jgi:hypothetical protein
VTREDRTKSVADRLAIRDVIVNYAVGVDERDWERVRSCFTNDAYVAGSRLEAAFEDYFPFLCTELEKFDRTVHFVGNHLSSVDGSRATAETYAWAQHFTASPSGALSEMSLGVVYRDELGCRSDTWRINRRAVTVQWMRETKDVRGTVTVPGLVPGGGR